MQTFQVPKEDSPHLPVPSRQDNGVLQWTLYNPVIVNLGDVSLGLSVRLFLERFHWITLTAVGTLPWAIPNWTNGQRLRQVSTDIDLSASWCDPRPGASALIHGFILTHTPSVPWGRVPSSWVHASSLKLLSLGILLQQWGKQQMHTSFIFRTSRQRLKNWNGRWNILEEEGLVAAWGLDRIWI